MIHLEDVSFRYETGGGFALHVPSLHIEVGRKAAIVGPSGCGKTTLVHLIAGILRPRSGRVRLGEMDLAAAPEPAVRAYRINHIGLIFQRFELLEYLSVRRNILLPYTINPALRLDDAARRRCDDLAETLGIAAVLDRKPDVLSVGEMQRAAIARAMITEPDLIIGDEPTGNLDPDTTRAILDLVFALVDGGRRTFLMVTHDHTLLERFDRVIDMGEFAEEHRRDRRPA